MSKRNDSNKIPEGELHQRETQKNYGSRASAQTEF